MLPRLDNIPKVIRYKCKTGTNAAHRKRCSCQKNGIFCLMACSQCQGEECSNEPKSSIIDDIDGYNDIDGYKYLMLLQAFCK